MAVATVSEQAHADAAPRRSLGDVAPAAVAAFAVVASFVGYLVANRHLWFFGDDWAFLLGRPLTHNTAHNLFAPHNEHWSTLPVISFRVLYSLFGLHHYIVFEIPVLLLHAGICAILWVLMRRAGAPAWFAAGGVVLAAVCGGGSENLLWDFQIGFVGSVFFGLLAILIADGDTFSRRRLIWTWVALVLSLMSSGISVPMVIVAVVFAGLRHGRRAAIATASVPLVVYLLWYLTYGHRGTANDKTSLGDRLKTAQYIWQGMTNTWQVNTNIPNAGALILLAIALPVLLFGLRDRLGRLAMALLSGEVGLFVLTGWTRVRLGVSQADVSRYVYVSTMLTIVAAVWSSRALVRQARRWVPEHRPTPIVVALVLGVLLTLVSMAAEAHQFYSGRVRLVKNGEQQILAAAQLIRQDAPTFVTPYPEGHYNPDVTSARLAQPAVLKALPTFTLTPAQEITTRGVMQVAVRPGSRIVPMNGTVELTSSGQSLANGESSCLVGTADSSHPVLVTDASGRADVTVSTTGPVFTQLRYKGLTSPVTSWKVPATAGGAGAVVVTMSQPGATLLVYTTPNTSFTVCRS